MWAYASAAQHVLRTEPDALTRSTMASRGWGGCCSPRGPVIVLPADFCLCGDAAAECAVSRMNIETHEPRS